MKKAITAVFVTAALLGIAWIGSPTKAAAQWVGQPAPEITNDTWIHSEPLRLEDLRGKVVLLEFWTYG